MTNEIHSLIVGFAGGAISSFFILSMMNNHIKKMIKEYNKTKFELKQSLGIYNFTDDIKALKMRMCSLETVLNNEK